MKTKQNKKAWGKSISKEMMIKEGSKNEARNLWLFFSILRENGGDFMLKKRLVLISVETSF